MGAGLSARQLSLKLRMSPSYVARVERGERTLDVIEFLDLCRVLGVDSATILNEISRAAT